MLKYRPIAFESAPPGRGRWTPIIFPRQSEGNRPSRTCASTLCADGVEPDRLTLPLSSEHFALGISGVANQDQTQGKRLPARRKARHRPAACIQRCRSARSRDGRTAPSVFQRPRVALPPRFLSRTDWSRRESCLRALTVDWKRCTDRRRLVVPWDRRYQSGQRSAMLNVRRGLGAISLACNGSGPDLGCARCGHRYGRAAHYCSGAVSYAPRLCAAGGGCQ